MKNPMRALERRVRLPGPVDLDRNLARMKVHGSGPTQRKIDGAVVSAFRTEAGPATVAYRMHAEGEVHVTAWGSGSELALELAPAHLGVYDTPEDFETDDPIVAPLLRRHRGVRIGRAPRVMERIVPIIIAQKVTGKGAAQSWRQLVHRFGEPAPGPHPLWLTPTIERYREMAYYDFHPLGIERKRAQIILECVRRARRIEGLAKTDPATARKSLMALRGIGPWTTGLVVNTVFGDADSIAVGDYHLPNMVVYAFTGEARGNDEQMLELLEPFRPHRARVLSLLGLGGYSAPRFGPRMPVRDIRNS